MMYWTDDQIKLYKEALEFNDTVSLDASGKFIKIIELYSDGKTAYLFLYVIVIHFNDKIYPVGQMLSEIHNTIHITQWRTYWLEAFSKPKQMVVDGSLALLNSLCLSIFNLYYTGYLDKYFDFFMNKIVNIPEVIIRRDRNHLFKNVRYWK